MGEHLHDLGLFLFQTSAIKYSKFRSLQVRIHSEFFLDESQHQQLCKTVISRVPEFQIKRTLYGWKAKKLSTTFIQTTFQDSVVTLLKNRIQPKLFPDSRLHRDFNLKQRYLTNQIRYGGDLEALERYLSLVIPTKISEFLVM